MPLRVATVMHFLGGKTPSPQALSPKSTATSLSWSVDPKPKLLDPKLPNRKLEMESPTRYEALQS